MASAPKRTPRLDPEVRRRQILDAALRVAAEEGLGDMTVEAIATAVGVTRPVVYDLFGDLAGVVDALLGECERRAQETIAASLPEIDPHAAPDDLLEPAAATFLGAVRSDPLLWQLILTPEENMTAAIQARVRRVREQVSERVAELVELSFRSRPELAGIDSSVFARLVIAAAEEMARLVVTHPERYTPERVAAEGAKVVRLFAPREGSA